tara:strand:+ start:2454 stop:2603 length:150 start_codon:yes stop_codon:yes gene_type:complete
MDCFVVMPSGAVACREMMPRDGLTCNVLMPRYEMQGVFCFDAEQWHGVE